MPDTVTARRPRITPYRAWVPARTVKRGTIVWYLGSGTFGHVTSVRRGGLGVQVTIRDDLDDQSYVRDWPLNRPVPTLAWDVS